MAVLAVVGLAAAGAAHDRSDDSVGRSGLPLIGLTLSGNDSAHFSSRITMLGVTPIGTVPSVTR